MHLLVAGQRETFGMLYQVVFLLQIIYVTDEMPSMHLLTQFCCCLNTMDWLCLSEYSVAQMETVSQEN